MRIRRGLVLLALVLAGCSAAPESADPATAPAPSATATPASSSPIAPPTTARQAPVYIALGDSLAAGFQPDQGDVRDTAYPALLRDQLAGAGLDVDLRNLACSGERTSSFLTGGRCPFPEGSQLSAAIAAMKAADTVALVTIDIGGNDVLQCTRSQVWDRTCVTNGLATARTNVPLILKRLRAAAGPSATIAIATYYDPFLADSLAGDPAKVAESVAVLTKLNATITAAAAASNAVVVDIPKAFKTGDTTKAQVKGKASTVAVGEVCRLTWYCEVADIHLTDAGAQVYAATIAAAVTPKLGSALAR